MAEELRQVLLENCLADDGFNTRQRGLGDLTDLTASISAIGIKEPLLGKDRENAAGEIEIFAGFRRLEAAKTAGLKVVPVLVSNRRDVTRKQMLLTNVAENIQRQDLNPVDEAYALQRLQEDHKMSTDDLCANLGVKKSRVVARFRLLKLSEPVRNAVHDDRIPIVAALEIDRLPHDKQERYVELAEELGGSKLRALIDKELEKIQKKIEAAGKVVPPKDPVDPNAVKEKIKGLKKASSSVCVGILGYDDEMRGKVAAVNYKVMDDEDLTVVAKVFEDLADQVEVDVDYNEKAQEEITAYVESGGQHANKLYNIESPVFRSGIFRMVGERSAEIAKEQAMVSGKRARVTFAIARQALDEIFCDFETDEDSE